MKRYEYMTRTHALGKLSNGSFAPTLEVWLNELGTQGWHLSAMECRPSRRTDRMSNETFCVFARLVEERT
jgi:hypothetical protein